MPRRLFALCSALSLLLCVAVCMLWFRSYDHADRLHGRLGPKRSFLLASKQGRLAVVGFRWHGSDDGRTWQLRSYPADHVLSFPAGDARRYGNRFGFGTIHRPVYFVMDPVQQTPQGPMYVWGAAAATFNGWGVVVPLWLPAVLTAAAAAAFAAARVRRRRRDRVGRCRSCGYDLTANVSGVCPECGLQLAKGVAS